MVAEVAPAIQRRKSNENASIHFGSSSPLHGTRLESRPRAIQRQLQRQRNLRVLRDRLGTARDRVNIEVVPGIALHPFRSPAAQDESIARLVAWADGLTAT